MQNILRSPVSTLRSAKHRFHRWWWWWHLDRQTELLLTARKVRPYEFDEKRWYNTFLAMDPPPSDIPLQREVPSLVWCIWAGDNAMSEQRQRGLASIREMNPAAEVILVTPANLGEYVLPEAPLHPIYPSLSLVHRSDYLRGYLLHHYGGAYADIKPQLGSIQDAITELNADRDRWLVGSPIPRFPPAIAGESDLDRECRRHFDLLPCGGAYAARAGTPLTHEWVAEVARRCDYYQEVATRHPGETWGVWVENGPETRYPIHWNVLQANVLEPLCLKYASHVLLHEGYAPQLHDYR